MSFRCFARTARLSLGAIAVLAGTTACWSVEDPNAEASGGGKVIVYGRVTAVDGSGLGSTRVTVRHHTVLCAGRINETEWVNTAADGRYRTVITVASTPGCLSVLAQPAGVAGLTPDSVMNVRPAFRSSEPFDSVLVNLTLRGGIQ